jgi:phage antirepressor YoqD-like protein
MTLKEITDLLDVRHNNAIRTVSEMAESPDFGDVTKIEYRTKMGNTYETYALNQRQSIAVAAKLNTSMLMRVIDRWQELESNKVAMPTHAEALRLWADCLDKIQLDAPKVKFAEIISDSSNTRCIRVWVKAMKHENNLVVGEREVFKWLVDNGYIFKDGNGYLPYAKYEANGKNYFTIVIEEINGRPRRMLKITGKGVVALTGKVIEYFTFYPVAL